MRLAILALLCAVPQESSDAEKIYRDLETRLAAAARIDVVYRRVCPDDSVYGNAAGGLLMESSEHAVTLFERRLGGAIGWFGSRQGPARGRGNPRTFECCRKALLAAGMHEVINVRSGHRQDFEKAGIWPTLTASDFKLTGDKGERILEFNVKCAVQTATTLVTHKGAARVWINPTTGWPSRRTLTEEDDGRVHTEIYYRFQVDAPPAADLPPDFARRVKGPSPAEVKKLLAKDARYKRILDWILLPEHWNESAREVEAALGPIPRDAVVHVVLDDAEGGDCAKVTRDPRDRRVAVVTFNLKAIASHENRRSGRPPPAPDSLPNTNQYVPHALVHILQRGRDVPAWFREGLPSWLAGDPYFVATFLDKAKSIEEIDVKPAVEEGEYGRGHLFMTWLERKAGHEVFPKLVKAVCEDGVGVPAAVSKLLGLEWDVVKKEELEWTRQRGVREK